MPAHGSDWFIPLSRNPDAYVPGTCLRAADGIYQFRPVHTPDRFVVSRVARLDPLIHLGGEHFRPSRLVTTLRHFECPMVDPVGTTGATADSPDGTSQAGNACNRSVTRLREISPTVSLPHCARHRESGHKQFASRFQSTTCNVGLRFPQIQVPGA